MADRFFELDKNSFSRYLGRTLCMCIEISHSLIDTYYFTNNTAEIIADGKTFMPYPFDLILPSQTEQQGTQLTMSNIHNYAANVLEKTIDSNENIVVKLYLANVEDNTAELIPRGEYEIMNVTVTNEAAVANINIRHCLNINIGKYRYTKQNFPNLFL